MTTSAEKRTSESDRQRLRSDLRQMLPPLIGFFVVEGTLDAFNPDGSANAWNFVWSISPMLFVLWCVLGAVSSVRRADEYQRRVHLESMAVGFGATMVTAIAFTLLDAGRILHTSNAGGYVLYAGAIAWVGGLAIKSMQAR